jgi:hypothetical protein
VRVSHSMGEGMCGPVPCDMQLTTCCAWSPMQATQRHGSLPPTEAGALLDKVSFIMRGARRQAQASSQQQQQQQPPSPPQESRPRVSDSDKASALATQVSHGEGLSRYK